MWSAGRFASITVQGHQIAAPTDRLVDEGVGRNRGLTGLAKHLAEAGGRRLVGGGEGVGGQVLEAIGTRLPWPSRTTITDPGE